jgi:competence protein ComFC
MRWILTLHRAFLDVFFPQYCRGCQIPQSLLCDTCMRDITLNTHQVCPHCKCVQTSFGQSCDQCTSKHALDGIFVMASYKNRLLARCIHALKYDCIREYASYLGITLGDSLQKNFLSHSAPLSSYIPQALIPIPLHSRRLRWRGFNQSFELAKSLQNSFFPLKNIPILEPLIRTKFTASQMSISDKKQRKRNVVDAFAWRQNLPDFPIYTPSQVQSGGLDDMQTKQNTVWLIDDVTTTTATLSACATIIKQHGATHVYGIVLAR